jgi:hypothetical protein
MQKGQEVNHWRKQIAGSKNSTKNVIPPVTVHVTPQGPERFIKAVLNRWHHLSKAEKVFYLALILVAAGTSVFLVKLIIDQYSAALDSNPQAANSVQVPPIMFFNDRKMQYPSYNHAVVKKEVQKRSRSVAKERENCLKDNDLEKLIDQLQISFDLSKLKNTLGWTKQLIETLSRAIKQELQEASHPTVISSVIRCGNFSISIEPKASYYQLTGSSEEKHSTGTPFGVYVFTVDKMYFFLSRENSNRLSAFRHIVHNECSHAASTRTNQFFTNVISYYPLLSQDGSLNPVLAVELVNAINDGQKRIMHYVDLLFKLDQKRVLTNNEVQALETLESLVADYAPLGEHQLVVSAAEASRLIKQSSNGIQYIYEMLPGYENSLRLTLPITNVERRGDMVYMTKNPYDYFSRLKFGKILIFFYDHFRRMDLYVNGDYGAEAGKKRPTFELATEILSSFEEYTNKVLQRLFPEICDYLSQYHEVDDRCNNQLNR